MARGHVLGQCRVPVLDWLTSLRNFYVAVDFRPPRASRVSKHRSATYRLGAQNADWTKPLRGSSCG
jgi:hypothetical protein